MPVRQDGRDAAGPARHGSGGHAGWAGRTHAWGSSGDEDRGLGAGDRLPVTHRADGSGATNARSSTGPFAARRARTGWRSTDRVADPARARPGPYRSSRLQGRQAQAPRLATPRRWHIGRL